ncbi:DUF445 domain-containing protein [Pseudoneobacillus rhizosphaerae]|jgi:uncharacterized membrane-anchored protein YjiN (DUF445 family)|uniref:DUF445 domain-containing protein n=1 Tax=Pseudoneobacillus rhizosphaerae TaxID=2880968 RepID=A0A9C7GAH6_9BACI|nr:DUF445 domain-containing protein [Pseudoneobacillus rhizosphaerae]CAG9609006.1 hypothetical protein NEOCIP111885_02725 [Pseudoneobacillus rhizosphaerae]
MMKKRERKSKYFAKISLVVMGAGFLITTFFQDHFIGRLLQGGFEAGLVGGLADWFAVTALFRHPLGIPIPHTALLPKNRNRMIRALISMLENDWLTKESIQGKIKQIKFTDKLLQIAKKELSTNSLNKAIGSLLFEAVSQANLEKLTPFIEKELKRNIRSINVTGFLESMVHQVINKKLDEKALDYVLVETEKWMEKEETKVKIGIMAKQLLDNTEADGFLKMAINSFSNLINAEKLGNLLQPFILKRIVLLQESDNPYRHLILTRIRKELVSVQDREELLAAINDWKESLINNWSPAEQITRILEQLQSKLLLLTEDAEFIDRYVLSFIRNLLDKMEETPEKIDSIENWIQKQIFHFIDHNHAKIGILVKENLEKLDNETLIDLMENNIGKDLQWIRVNGAICGFFIGIVLTIFQAIV